MHLMLDIDGPFADFTGGFQTRVQRRDRRFYPKAREYDFGVEQWGWSRERWLESLDWFAAVGGYRSLRPTPGSVRAVREILEAGHQVTFYTLRPESVEGDTVDWLTEMIGASAGSGWQPRFTRDDKLDGHLYDVAFDDRADHAETLHASGCRRSVICDRPWSGVSPSGLERLPSIGDLWQSIRAHYSKVCV